MTRRCVFISYARDDGPRVQKDVALLRAGGVRVFIDVQDIEAGSRWEVALEMALAQCERVIVFWSHAAKGSTWVEREWRTALGLGKRVVPALLDDTVLPPELAALQGLHRSQDSPGASFPTWTMSASAWLGAVIIAAILGWATYRGVEQSTPDQPAIAQPPGIEASAPIRSASAAAGAAAAVDKVRDQALLLSLQVARAADDETSATTLREGREQLESAIRGLPIASMALSDIHRLNVETRDLLAAIDARGAQFPDGSATGRELELLKRFFAVSQSVTRTPAAPDHDENILKPISVLGIITFLITSVLLIHLLLKRRRARKFVDAVFET